MSKEQKIAELGYHELSQKFDELLAEPLKREEFPDPTIFQISGYPHYEDVISNWYAFFLNNEGEHGMKDLFLSALVEIINKGFDNDFSIETCKINREHHTDNGGYIDLLVYEQYDDEYYKNAIIIENKIKADLYNDLDDYYTSVKVADNDKVGIVLTLNKVEVDDDRFINITHNDWLGVVKTKLGEYLPNANPKYVLYLQDFINNLEQMTKPQEMLDSVKYYFENAERIQQLVNLKDNANKFIVDQFSQVILQTDWEWGRVGSVSISFRQSKHQITGYLYYTEIFNKHKFTIELWLYGNSVKKWNELSDKSPLAKAFADKLTLRETKDPKEWARLADKVYQVDGIKDIETFGEKVNDILKNDWQPFVDKVVGMIG